MQSIQPLNLLVIGNFHSWLRWQKNCDSSAQNCMLSIWLPVHEVLWSNLGHITLRSNYNISQGFIGPKTFSVFSQLFKGTQKWTRRHSITCHFTMSFFSFTGHLAFVKVTWSLFKCNITSKKLLIQGHRGLSIAINAWITTYLYCASHYGLGYCFSITGIQFQYFFHPQSLSLFNFIFRKFFLSEESVHIHQIFIRLYSWK